MSLFDGMQRPDPDLQLGSTAPDIQHRCVWFRENSAAQAAIARVREAIEREHARGCSIFHQQGTSEECCSCAAARIEDALSGTEA